VAVDLLNRSLLPDLLAVQGLRGLGLYALDASVRCAARRCAKASRRMSDCLR
jgi:hypothetical protein